MSQALSLFNASSIVRHLFIGLYQIHSLSSAHNFSFEYVLHETSKQESFYHSQPKSVY